MGNIDGATPIMCFMPLLLHYDLLGVHFRVTILQAIYLAYETFYYYRYMVGLVCYKRPLRGPCSVLWVDWYLCTAE